MTSRTLTFVASTVGGAVAVAMLWHTFYGHTLDVGLHYALVKTLFLQLGGTDPGVAHLGVMAHYPRGAHWIAAHLAEVAPSPLVSINVIAILCIYVTYLVVARLLIEGGRRANLVSLGVMAAATWWLADQYAAFGYQVMLNFFFPQLLGETVVVVALYGFTLKLFRNLSPWPQTMIVMMITWLIGYVQPLAALQLAACYGCVLLLSVSCRPDGAAINPRSFMRPVLRSVLTLAVAVSHPDFRTMTVLASNDGYLRFGDWLGSARYAGLGAFALASAGMTLWNAHRGTRDRRRSLVLAAATIAAIALLAAQDVARLVFNLGSEYAVKKHVFFLALISATTFAYAMPGLSRLRSPASSFTRDRVLLPPVFALLALWIVLVTAAVWRQDLAAVLDLQEFAGKYQKSFPVDAFGNTISADESLSPILNYVVSFGDLRLPYEIATAATLSQSGLSAPVKYAIVSRQQADPGVLELCQAGAAQSDGFVLVDRACQVDSPRVLGVDEAVKTVAGERGTRYLVGGWSSPEAWATWSVGDSARIEFSVLPEHRGDRYELLMKYIPFIGGARQQQALTVIADGSEVQRLVVAGPSPRESLVPIVGTGHHLIELKIEDPVSPRALGVSPADDRKLGIALMELRLVPRR